MVQEYSLSRDNGRYGQLVSPPSAGAAVCVDLIALASERRNNGTLGAEDLTLATQLV